MSCTDTTEELPTRGIAFDGRDLWALDTKSKRICIIERTESRTAYAREG